MHCKNGQFYIGCADYFSSIFYYCRCWCYHQQRLPISAPFFTRYLNTLYCSRCWCYHQQQIRILAPFFTQISKYKYAFTTQNNPLVFSMHYPIYPACFFTATNLNWKPLLSRNVHKDIVMNSLRYMQRDKKISLYAFVIMSNHLHLIWQPLGKHTPKQNQHNFLKYTAQQIKFNLMSCSRLKLEVYRVNASDREYQFWERNALSIELYTERVFLQKLNYIHQNPVKARLTVYPEDYRYSSARFYETGIDEWNILSHYRG